MYCQVFNTGLSVKLAYDLYLVPELSQYVASWRDVRCRWLAVKDRNAPDFMAVLVRVVQEVAALGHRMEAEEDAV